MKRDLRGDRLYKEVFEHFKRIHEPGLGQLIDASDLSLSYDGSLVAVCGTSYTQLSGRPKQRIALAGIAQKSLTMLDSSGSDMQPRWSPKEQRLAFLSDRECDGKMQLYVYDVATGAVSPYARELNGSGESLSWSPDGTALLIIAAGLGADRAGAAGSGTIPDHSDLPDWVPHTEETVPDVLWRRLWIYSFADGSLRRAGPDAMTFWEAQWCGPHGCVAVVSDNPRESSWHNAELAYVSLEDDAFETIYRPGYEIGLPVATADGRYVAVVEGSCSDRSVVSGDVLIFDRDANWRRRVIEIADTSATSLAVRDDTHLSVAGIRGFEIIAGEIDLKQATWSLTRTTDQMWMRRYPGVVPLSINAYVTVAHAYGRPPHLVSFSENGSPEVLHDFANAGLNYLSGVGGELSRLTWKGRDGLEIQGYLAKPISDARPPLVVYVHGGPVSAYTNAWQMGTQLTPLLVSRGYVVLHPNPRGSSGRGEWFSRMVRGDIGGEEAYDILRGVEMLVEQDAVDRRRIFVLGGSHGGYMAAWLVSQCDTFAASVSLAPVTDWFSFHFTSNDPVFDRLFLDSDPYDRAGKHFTRSPITFARDVKTPTLLIAGGRDRITPANQAIEFHRALVETGVSSELIVYPKEGHGVRDFESYVDYGARVLDWLSRHKR